MKKLKIFLTLTGYQLTWLACVFGESKLNMPMLGIYVGALYLLLFLYYNKNKKNFIKLALLISIPGYFFDTLIVYFSIYEFKTQFKFGLLPIWMIFLWLSFSTLFDEILVFFKKYKIIGIFLSGILGPITYYLGESLGVIYINNLTLFFITMIIFWFLLMIYYLEFILKN